MNPLVTLSGTPLKAEPKLSSPLQKTYEISFYCILWVDIDQLHETHAYKILLKDD